MSEQHPSPAQPTAFPVAAHGTTVDAAQGVAQALTPSQLVAVERYCDEFEDRLQAGEAPDVVEFLTRAPEPVRYWLFCELVRLERVYRPADSDGHTTEYRERFPEYAAALDELTRSGTRTGTGLATAADSTRDGGDALGERFGPYVLLGRVAAGGMGVVYRARDARLEREVALKMILGGDRARPEELIRFLVEAQAVAAIDHPHVVRVLEFGEQDDRPFLALEFLTGGTLTRRIEQAAPLDPRVAAELCRKVAAGVAAAHAQGIVHRDLKPSNILFDSAGEPKVTDFGLAKRGAGADLTATRAVMGTPAYMAPEQASGGTKFVGPAADVWALGVILYECLTGKRPFTGESTDDVLHAVIHSTPPTPRDLIPAVPRDLNLIVGKCLEKDARDRYPTANELAEELRRFVAGEPISVRPAGRVEKLAKWVRRKPMVAGLYAATTIALAVIVVALGFAALWWDAEGARRQTALANDQLADANLRVVAERDENDRLRNLAEQARDQKELARQGEEVARTKAETLAEKLAHVEYGLTMQLAREEWRDSNIYRASELLTSTMPEYRGWEWQYVHRLCHPDLITLTEHTSSVTSVAWSPDGQSILTGSFDKTAKIWGVATERTTLTFNKHTAGVTAVAWSPDGNQAVTGSVDQSAKIWDTRTGKESHSLVGHTDVITSVGWSPDGKQVVTGSVDNTARIWDAVTGNTIRILRGHAGRITAVGWSPDGKQVVTGSADKTAKLWNADTGEESRTLTGHTATVLAVAWRNDGQRIVTGGGDKTVRIWNARTGDAIHTLTGHIDAVWSVAWSPNGKQIATTGYDSTVRVWDAQTGIQMNKFVGHPHQVLSVAWRPDGTQIAAAGYDRTVRVWDTLLGAEALTFPGPLGQLQSATWSPNGEQVVTVNSARTMHVWNARRGEPLFLAQGKAAGAILCASYSPDGKWIVTGGKSGEGTVWDAQNYKPGPELIGHTDAILSAAYSPDGKWIVTGSADKTVRVWNAQTKKTVAILRSHTDRITSVAFSPRGDRLVTVGFLQAKVWNTRTWMEILTLGQNEQFLAPNDEEVGSPPSLWAVPPSSGPLGTASFSPDGSRIVTGGLVGRVWDAQTGAELLLLRGNAEKVLCAAYSPDGSRIVTGGGRDTVKLWDATTGAEVFTLKGHKSRILTVSFSSDGSRILTASEDGIVKVWDCSPVNRAFLPKEVAPAPRPRGEAARQPN
jgi:eukaryotic-like serine/threonine-protein kinase